MVTPVEAVTEAVVGRRAAEDALGSVVARATVRAAEVAVRVAAVVVTAAGAVALVQATEVVATAVEKVARERVEEESTRRYARPEEALQ